MAKTKEVSKKAVEDEAIRIVDAERRQWETAPSYVTPTVGFNMRKLIETLRKNYWGVFNTPTDPNTGRAKIWMPMTMRDVEAVIKNSDLDLKDLMFRAKYPEAAQCTEVTRHIVREYLQDMYFGETLDEAMRQMVLDGTVVWKTWEEDGKMKRKTVDLLNLYIDPTEESIQSAYRFTERSLMLPSAIKGMSWDNKEVVGATNLDRNNATYAYNTTTAKLTDVWEMWGKIPAWMITLNKNDEDEIDGHIIVSGLQAGKASVHLVEKNTKKGRMGEILKPYEEGRLAKVSGRWYGLGVAERELALQEYLNASVNVRINRQTIAQLGLFKIRNGSGLTPQMLKGLSVNGIIPVNSQEDIQQLPMTEPGQSAYNDEMLIKEWGQSITQAYAIASGESLPASQTATTSAIQSTSAKSGYTMIKDAMGFFLQRWMDRHALPIIAKSVKTGDVVRIVGGVEGYKELTEKVVAYYAQEYLNQNPNVTVEEIARAMDVAEEELRNRDTLFIKNFQKIMADGLESYFYTNNESLDTAVTVQNLVAMLNMAPEYRDATVNQIYDLLGLARPKKQAMAMQGAGSPPAMSNAVQNMTQQPYGIGQGNAAALTQG
jgi:hypothetical protein